MKKSMNHSCRGQKDFRLSVTNNANSGAVFAWSEEFDLYNHQNYEFAFHRINDHYKSL